MADDVTIADAAVVADTTVPRVFLAHRHSDAADARELATRLRTEHGIDVWFDEWEIPGTENFVLGTERGLREVHGGLVLVGPSGVGSWTYEEYADLLRRAVESRRALPGAPDPFVMPVYLPDAAAAPAFLGNRSGHPVQNVAEIARDIDSAVRGTPHPDKPPLGPPLGSS